MNSIVCVDLIMLFYSATENLLSTLYAQPALVGVSYDSAQVVNLSLSYKGPG